MRGPRLASCQEPAAPPDTASTVFSRSAPCAAAKTSASATEAQVPATRIWFTSFVVWPMPDGPISVMLVPIASNTGRQRSKVSCSPPTMIVSVACSRRPTNRR